MDEYNKDNQHIDLDEHYEELSGLYRKKPFSQNYLYASRKNTSKVISEEKKESLFANESNLPSELNDEYYDNYIEKYTNRDREYWDWLYIRKYMEKVRIFYLALSNVLYRKFEPINKSSLPKFINLELIGAIDINDLASQLSNAEKELSQQFNKFKERSVVSSYFNKYNPLKRLQLLGAKAWTMYHMLNKDLPVRDVIKFTDSHKRFLNSGFHNDEDLITMYRGATIVNREVRLYVKPNLLSERHPFANLYDDIASDEVYNELISSIGGYTTDEYDNIMTYVLEYLGDKVGSDNDINELISFYNSYDEIYKNIYDINAKTNELNLLKSQRTVNRLPLFSYDSQYDDGGSFDMYETCIEDIHRAKHILSTNKYVNDKIRYDLSRIIKVAKGAIDNASALHEETHEI